MCVDIRCLFTKYTFYNFVARASAFCVPRHLSQVEKNCLSHDNWNLQELENWHGMTFCNQSRMFNVYYRQHYVERGNECMPQLPWVRVFVPYHRCDILANRERKSLWRSHPSTLFFPCSRSNEREKLFRVHLINFTIHPWFTIVLHFDKNGDRSNWCMYHDSLPIS